MLASMTPTSDDPLRDCPERMSPREAGAALGRSRQTISNWLNLKDHPLPGIRLPGGSWLIRREELRAWLAERHN